MVSQDDLDGIMTPFVLSDKQSRLVELSWKLLEAKCAYYVMSKSIMSDFEYDTLEKEYDSLCIELNVPNSVGDMVDFDTSRPACQIVMDKMGVNKPIARKK